MATSDDESRLLKNLRDMQAFDSALKKGDYIDVLARRYASEILFTPVAARRTTAIQRLSQEIISHYQTTVQPAALQVGERSARSILTSISKSVPPNVNNTVFQRRVLIDLQVRTQQRLKIVQAAVADGANTLENRLLAYWLEPGTNDEQKLNRMRELHKQQAERIAEYNKKLKAFDKGEVKTKPPQPKVEFLEKTQADAKRDVREQSRRTASDSQLSRFESQGYTSFAWITVNASEACPDCRKRQGVVGDRAFWDEMGTPGAGRTVCGASCYCMLSPAGILTKNPQLSAGLNSRVTGVVTTDKEAKKLDDHRPGL